MTNRSLPRLGAGLAAVVALGIAAVPASAAQLKGTFRISAGSYFRMIYPAAAKSKSKYFSNPYSTDPDKTYTLVTGGTDGGLRTGVLQSPPSPAFDGKGNSLAGAIIHPTSFTGIEFGLVTVGTAPSISVSGGRLSGQLIGFTAQWNKLSFKQGSSKVSGTYNATTHAYVLTWTSTISGGPFNGFTGYWHLQGKFVS
jgi:hypothetical protein